MINSLDSSLLLKSNAPLYVRIEVSSGKSIRHSLFKLFTLKYHARTLIEWIPDDKRMLNISIHYSST